MRGPPVPSTTTSSLGVIAAESPPGDVTVARPPRLVMNEVRSAETSTR